MLPDSRAKLPRQRADARPSIWAGIFPFSSLRPSLGLLVVSAYLIRSSLLVIWFPGLAKALLVSVYLLLGLSLVYSLLSAREVSFAGVLLLLACLPGSWFAEQREVSLLKYGGWAILLLVAGPLLAGPNARRVRNQAWNALAVFLALIGVASCLWWLLRLPVLGLGLFTGVMTYSNTVGAIAGLGAVLAAGRAIASQSWPRLVWIFITMASILTCLASGARASALAMGAGLAVVLFVERRKVNLLQIFILAFGLMAGLAVYKLFIQAEDSTEITSGLMEKGLENTREFLWAARWQEFHENPLCGVGVGLAKGEESSGNATDEEGDANVEPGSSYLAVLSMTGLSGAAGFGIFFLSVGVRFSGRYRFLPAGVASELLGAGTFLFFNGIAEGWILAVGSPLCMIFWLWLGYLVDVLGEQKPERKTKVKIQQ